MLDGRSKPPPAPDCVRLELMTRKVNLFLGTHYTPEQIAAMPDAWLYKIDLLAEAVNNGR